MTHPEFARGLPGTLTLGTGQVASFPLAGAMGAGNTWSATTSDAGSVAVAVEVTPPPAPSEPHPMSSTATETLVVRGVRPGTAVVTVRLARPWAPEPPLVEHEIRVSVPP